MADIVISSKIIATFSILVVRAKEKLATQGLLNGCQVGHIEHQSSLEMECIVPELSDRVWAASIWFATILQLHVTQHYKPDCFDRTQFPIFV